MLKQMRQGSTSIIVKYSLFGLLLLAMAGLALMDVQGMFRQGLSNTTIASFGHEKLSAIDFDRYVQQRIAEQRLKQSDAYRGGLPQLLLKEEINRRVFALAARDLGLRPDDKTTAKQVKDMVQPLVDKGMTQKEALKSLLQNYGLSEEQLVASLRTDTATQELMAAIVVGAQPSKLLVDEAMKYRSEWRSGSYFTLSSNDIPAAKAPTEEEMKAYYDSIAREYALPEYRALSVIIIDKNSLGDGIKISDDKLKEYYDDNISDYKTPESRVIAQAVAPDEETAKKIQAEAAKSRNLKKAAEAQKATFVKASSVLEAELPAELSKTAFAGEAGKVLAPIKSPLGWHVLSIEKVTPAVTKSFDSVKATIEKDLAQDKIAEVLFERAQKFEDDIAGGKTLNDVAKENGIKATHIAKVDAKGLGPNHEKVSAQLPLFDKIIEKGFALKKGAASQLIETPEGAYMIVSADEVYPSEQQAFEKVRTQIENRMMANNKVKALSDHSAKIMERLKKGDSFAKIAAEYKKTPEHTKLIKRGWNQFGAQMAQQQIDAIFSIDKQGDATAIPLENAILIMQLAERKIDLGKEAKKDTETLHDVINRTLKQDLLEQYRLALMEEYNVTVNDKLLAEMYTPKDDAAGAMGEEE